MVFRMRVTFSIDDQVMRRVKAEAARRKVTISELVEAALRQMLEAPVRESGELPPLPTFDGGRSLVDISDREALYDAMEKDP